MGINDYIIGAFIRTATEAEAAAYRALDAAGEVDSGSGAIEGERIATDLAGMIVWLD